MIRTKYLLLILAIIGIGVLAFFTFRWLQPDLLDSDEIQAITLERYHTDEIETLDYNSQDQSYELTFRRGESLYELVLNGTSGSVQSLILLEQREEPIEEETAQAILADFYSGDTVAFTQTELQDNSYLLAFTINGRTGTAEIDAYTGSIISNTLEEENVILSPERAGEIALSTVAGTIEDIEQETRNERLVYEVEIEDTGRDDDALVIIDAYTGEVISVIWD